jgi:hypothetical protein
LRAYSGERHPRRHHGCCVLESQVLLDFVDGERINLDPRPARRLPDNVSALTHRFFAIVTERLQLG